MKNHSRAFSIVGLIFVTASILVFGYTNCSESKLPQVNLTKLATIEDCVVGVNPACPSPTPGTSPTAPPTDFPVPTFSCPGLPLVGGVPTLACGAQITCTAHSFAPVDTLVGCAGTACNAGLTTDPNWTKAAGIYNYSFTNINANMSDVNQTVHVRDAQVPAKNSPDFTYTIKACGSGACPNGATNSPACNNFPAPIYSCNSASVACGDTVTCTAHSYASTDTLLGCAVNPTTNAVIGCNSGLLSDPYNPSTFSGWTKTGTGSYSYAFKNTQLTNGNTSDVIQKALVRDAQAPAKDSTSVTFTIKPCCANGATNSPACTDFPKPTYTCTGPSNSALPIGADGIPYLACGATVSCSAHSFVPAANDTLVGCAIDPVTNATIGCNNGLTTDSNWNKNGTGNFNYTFANILANNGNTVDVIQKAKVRDAQTSAKDSEVFTYKIKACQ